MGVEGRLPLLCKPTRAYGNLVVNPLVYPFLKNCIAFNFKWVLLVKITVVGFC